MGGIPTDNDSEVDWLLLICFNGLKRDYEKLKTTDK